LFAIRRSGEEEDKRMLSREDETLKGKTLQGLGFEKALLTSREREHNKEGLRAENGELWR